MAETEPALSPRRPQPRWLLAVACLVVGAAGGWLAGRASVGEETARAGSSAPSDSSGVLARVGDEVLTVSQLAVRWDQVSPAERSFHQQHGGQRQFLDQLVEEMLLAAEARRRGFDARPDVREMVRSAADRAVARPLLAEEVRRAAMPESEVRAYFDGHRSEWTKPLRVDVSELVVTEAPGPPGTGATDDATTPAEAQRKVSALRARAVAGEDFAELARRYSEAPSARYGGHLGWVTAGQLAADYEAAALALAAGEVSPVLKTDRGLAILKALAREDAREPTFDEKREEIAAALLQEDAGALNRRYRVFLDELRAKTPVEVHPERLPQAASSEGGG